MLRSACITCWFRAKEPGRFIVPKDLPTIEALIALHKAIKKDEDKGHASGWLRVWGAVAGEKGAKSFNDVRTTLNTKMNNAYSYLVLAGPFLQRPTHCIMLVTEYKDFTVQHLQAMKKKPFCRMVLCRCQRGNIKGDTTLLQTVCNRGRFGHKPDEGFHG